MKKILATLTASVLLLAALPMTTYAHGHSNNRATSKTYTLCSVEDCSTTSRHRHSGVTYSGHYIDDGHDYHQVCSVQDCVQTSSHDHDGTACLPHNNADGHSYHNSGHGSRGHH